MKVEQKTGAATVHRRTGGLEKIGTCSTNTVNVHRRTGGLEKRTNADQ